MNIFKMKYSIALSVLLALVFSSSTFAQTSDIAEGLRTGNATTVAKYFDSTVWMCIEDTEDEYNASEAKELLNSFFEINKVTGFKRLHEAKMSRPGTEVLIGNLNTANGSYRVYAYVNKGANQFIDELRIMTP